MGTGPPRQAGPPPPAWPGDRSSTGQWARGVSAAETIVATVRAGEHGEQNRADALLAVGMGDLADVLPARIGDHAAQILCTGIAASPGAASGRVCLSVDAVLDTVDAGEPAVLVAMESGPKDEPGIAGPRRS